MPSLLFGTELFTPRLLLKHERCQSLFLRDIFHAPIFAPGLLLLKMSGLVSVAYEIAIRKLLFLGRLINKPNMAPAFRNLFGGRIESCLDANITFVGVTLSISEVPLKYKLFHYSESWCNNSSFTSF